MLMIRFAPRGKKNRPFYRLVVSEKARDLFGSTLEILGSYDPLSPTKDITCDAERIRYWMSHGAQLSPSVHNLLLSKKVIQGKVIKRTRKKKEKDSSK